MRWLIDHFRAHRNRSLWSFLWRVNLESVAVSFSLGVLAFLLRLPARELNMTIGTLIGFGVVVAPVFETFLFQGLPVGVARFFEAKFDSQVLLSTVLFTIAHFQAYGIGAIPSACAGGLYLAFTYAHWRERSRWTAFWMTALSHAVYNAFVVGLSVTFWGT